MRWQVQIHGCVEARAAAALALAAAGIDVIGGGELAPALLRIGDVSIDLRAHRAMRGGRPIRLTPQAWGLLSALAGGCAIGRAALLERVWGYRFDPGTNVLAVHVCRLRAKIGRDAIVSAGNGYRLALRNDPPAGTLGAAKETNMAKPPATPPNSDIDGVNMDARVGDADRGGQADPGGALKHSKDEAKARPEQTKPPE